MLVRLVCVALMTGCACVASSQPAAAEPLQPVKPWVLNYAVTQCIASRDYGDAENPTTLAIRAAPNGETYEFLTLQRGPAPKFAEELEGSIEFGAAPIKAWLLHFASTPDKLDVHQFRITAVEMQQAQSASLVTFHVKGDPDISFALRAIPALLTGLEKCTADLKTYWNFDGKKTGKIATPAKVNLVGILKGDQDYPSEALRRQQEGTARYLLMIDEKGLVADCHVQQTSGVPALDARTCQVLRERGKFVPARDRNGTPVRSMVITQPISWHVYG